MLFNIFISIVKDEYVNKYIYIKQLKFEFLFYFLPFFSFLYKIFKKFIKKKNFCQKSLFYHIF